MTSHEFVQWLTYSSDSEIRLALNSARVNHNDSDEDSEYIGELCDELNRRLMAIG